MQLAQHGIISTVVATVPPANIVAPSISGTANPGQTLTANNGTWSGSPTYTYQWKRQAVDIPGATSSTYVVRNNDIATDISVAVTATNAGGSASETTSSTAVVYASYETEYTAIQTNATTNSYTAPSTREKQFENRLVKYFKTVGIWNNFDFFYNFYHGGDGNYGRINWKNPGTYNASLVNSPTFTTYSGYSLNGTTQYINSNFVPSTNATAGSQNNASTGVYISSGGQSNGQDIGLITSTFRLAICARNTSNQTYANVNDNTTVTASNNTEAVGFYHAIRYTGAASELRRNNVSLTGIASTTSTGLGANNIYIGARNNSGTADLFSSRTIGAAWFGSTMSVYTNQINVGHATLRKSLNGASLDRGSFGTILNDNFNRSAINSTTADFISSVSDFTVDGTKMTVTSGANTYTRRLNYNYGNSFEQYTQTLSGALAVAPGASTYGIGVGISDFSTPDVERSVNCQVIFTSGSDLGKIVITTYDGTTATQRAISASGLPFANGDTYQITFNCAIVSGYRVYTATVVRNGGSSVQAQWTTANHAEGSSTGDFSIFNFGGTMTVTNWTISVDDIKHVREVWIGDSITHGHGATTLNTRFADQVSVSDFTVSAGNGDITQSVLNKLQNIIDLNPHRVFLMIGGNDVGLGVSSSTYQNNYTAIRNALRGHGIQVIHLLATPRDGVNMTTFNAWISGTFTSDPIVDTFTPLKDGGTGLNNTYDLGDGTHLNQAGYNLVASTILAAL